MGGKVQYLNQIYTYNLSLKEQIFNKIISIAVVSNRKNVSLFKPNNQFEILTPKELKALIEKYTKKCFQYFSLDEEREKFKEMIRVNNSYDEFQYLMYSLWYDNLIELKNQKNFNDLKKLYTSSFLINYSSEIPIKSRIDHQFCLDKFNNFNDEMYASFIKGITPPTLEDGITVLDYSSLHIDMLGLNGLFWKYCSINATFETVGQSIDLTRYLHDLLNDAKIIADKLFQNKKPSVDITKIASTGGRAKANKYLEKMNPIFDEVFDLYQHPERAKVEKWTKIECARYFLRQFYLNNPHAQEDNYLKDLDPRKLASEITKRINARSTKK